MKTICVLPWLTLDTLPDGSIAPCCYIENHKRFKSDVTSIKDYLSSTELNEIKTAMLKGEKPAACASCYKLEACGAESPRTKNNNNFLNASRKENILNGQSSNFEHLHLRLSNTCDLSCRSCSAFCSTSWNKDRAAMNPKLKPLTLDLFKESTQLEKDITELCSTVEHLYISGGEPVLDPRLPSILVSFIAGANLDKRNISIQTNLSNGHILKDIHMSLLSQIPTLYISVSIDGIGEKGEFIREGLNWEKFQSNLMELKKKLPHATIIYTPTISVYNVFHILELFNFFEEKNLLDESWIELNMVSSPSSLNPTILSKGLKEKVREAYKLHPSKNKKIKKSLDEILNYLFSEDNESELINFYSYTKTLDRLRNQDTLKLFPELKLGL